MGQTRMALGLGTGFPGVIFPITIAMRDFLKLLAGLIEQGEGFWTAFDGLSQEARREERAQELIEVKEALLAQEVDAPAQRSQSCPPSREKRCVHDKYSYLSMLDRQAKMTP